MIQEKLQELGLNKTEALTFLTVLENRKLSASAIGKLANLKRTTAYAAAEELVKKDILEKDTSKRSTYYIARSENVLKDYIKKQQRDLIQQNSVVDDLLPELKELPKSTLYAVPKITIVEGDDIFDFVYKQTPEWDRSMMEMDEPTWWGFQDHTFVDDIRTQEWIDWYWKQAPSKIVLKYFTNDSKVERETMKKKEIPRRHIKFWEGEKVTATQMAIGDYVLNIVTRKKPYYLLHIYNPLLAEGLRNLYQTLWEERK